MKAFLVGLLFGIAVIVTVFVLVGLVNLLIPLILLLGLFWKLTLLIIVSVFAIWLLGKVIIFAWESLRSKREV